MVTANQAFQTSRTFSLTSITALYHFWLLASPHQLAHLAKHTYDQAFFFPQFILFSSPLLREEPPHQPQGPYSFRLQRLSS